jgi:glycosyltransferase involved in cell wall biosynthesis
MHIGINAQLLSLGQNYRNGGVSRYIRYLLTELAKTPGEHIYTVYVNGPDVIEHLGVQHPQITYISAPWSESRPIERVLWEQGTLPSLLQKQQIDVLHSPVNVLPVRIPRRCATIVTLHDLAFLRYPEVLTRAKSIYHHLFTIRSLRRATKIITVSESTKQDAHDLVNIPLDRLHTVYPCIDQRFSNVSEVAKVQEFRQQHGLTDGYILYLGTLEPRKNIPTLINAYHKLRQDFGVREKLVLAGSKGWLYESIFARVHELGLEAEVIFPGYVTDSEQVEWYQAASAFAYPSLYEGFGMPIAEALACGIPVVTSNVSSLPEAGAQVALCVDPQSVEAVSQALYQALTDTELRERSRIQASSVAQKFSAHRMVQQTIEVYEQAANTLQKRMQRVAFVS